MRHPQTIAAMKAAMKASGKGAGEIAASCGVSRVAITKTLGGQTTLSVERLFEFCSLVGINPQDIGPLYLEDEISAIRAEFKSRDVDLLPPTQPLFITSVVDKILAGYLESDDQDLLKIIARKISAKGSEEEFLLLIYKMSAGERSRFLQIMRAIEIEIE